MSYKQLQSFTPSKGGNKPGYCLANVRAGYGIRAKYGTANEAWAHTKQHTDALPSGVAVPLFYEFGKDGHVNVLLANGKVWSDGVTYAGLGDYVTKHPSCHFRGWGESLNEIAVVKYVAPVQAANGMPAIGQTIHLNKGVTRTVFKPGTDTELGKIIATDDSFNYLIRGERGYRVVINSAKFGGAVELALFYTDGKVIDGWHTL